MKSNTKKNIIKYIPYNLKNVFEFYAIYSLLNKNGILRGCPIANLVINCPIHFSFLISTLSGLTLNIHRPFNRSSPVVDRRQVLTLRKVLNDLFTAQLVAGKDGKCITQL